MYPGIFRRFLNGIQWRHFVRWRTGWSFRAQSLRTDRRVVHEGERIIISCSVFNNGNRSGTVYTRFLVSDTYDRGHPIFDSDRDLVPNERRSLRVQDIGVAENRPVACSWVIPSGAASKHFDLRVDICNPHWLFRGPWPLVFHRVGWIGGFEVISKPNGTSLPAVFVSYSWDSEDHKRWVLELVEELRKHGVDCLLDQKDLLPGVEATNFMERAIANSSVTLLVCTDAYTRRADDREPGGVGFETIISSHEYFLRTPEERSRFIQIGRASCRERV